MDLEERAAACVDELDPSLKAMIAKLTPLKCCGFPQKLKMVTDKRERMIKIVLRFLTQQPTQGQ